MQIIVRESVRRAPDEAAAAAMPTAQGRTVVHLAASILGAMGGLARAAR
jgi:hypothetical protein